jgi:hypothetical protein
MTILKSFFKKGLFITSVLFLLIIVYNKSLIAQKLPEGYIEQFSNSCNNESLFKSFSTSKPEEWKTGKETFLKVIPCKDDSCLLNFSSKLILDSMIFGDYITEFEIKTEIVPQCSSIISFLSPIKSLDSYNALVISKDSVTYFLMDKGVLKKIDQKNVAGLKPGWNRIRIQRDINSRNTTITFNNLSSSKMVFNNSRLVMGYIGFAAGNTNTFVRNINIWAPTCITDNSFKW